MRTFELDQRNEIFSFIEAIIMDSVALRMPQSNQTLQIFFKLLASTRFFPIDPINLEF